MCARTWARSTAPVRHHTTVPATGNGDSQTDVLSQLPSKRPQRASARRARSAAKRPPATAAKASPQRSPAGGAKASRGKASTPRRRAASRSAAKPAGATPRAVRPSAATDRTREPGPQPGSARRPAARPAAPSSRPGVDMVETAVQAVGELAQIGMTFGIQALRGAISRLPKP